MLINSKKELVAADMNPGRGRSLFFFLPQFLPYPISLTVALPEVRSRLHPCTGNVLIITVVSFAVRIGSVRFVSKDDNHESCTNISICHRHRRYA